MELILACFCILLTVWLIWRWQYTSYFSRLGIPGPKPSLLFGNIIELYKKGPVKCHEEWVEKYGRILGYYYGMKRILLVADPQMLKHIFIKDFSKFINREPFSPLSVFNPKQEDYQSVLNLEGQKWKEVRSVLTPSYTAAKLKQMAHLMNSSVELMLKLMREKAEKKEEVNIHDTYQRLTTDVISRTAFGVRVDVQTNKKSKLMTATELFFTIPYPNPVIFVGLCFPIFRRLCLHISELILKILNKGTGPRKMLKKGLAEVLKQRRENPQGKNSDLLQLMLDTKISLKAEEIDLRKLEIGDAETEIKQASQDKSGGKDNTKVTRNMTDGEVLASCFTVLLAGYETTSTALAFTTYFLAKHQDVQEKVFQEIQEQIQEGETLEYATVNKLSYLDKVLNESMRLLPPVYLFTNRFAVEDVTYGDLKIPKGTLVQAPVYLMHHDPEFWQDPETFDPERFNTKPNMDGITFLPFGVGPRNCLGMRFAQMEAKLALAHMVYNFHIHLSPVHKDGLKTELRVRMIGPLDGVNVKLESRNMEAVL